MPSPNIFLLYLETSAAFFLDIERQVSFNEVTDFALERGMFGGKLQIHRGAFGSAKWGFLIAFNSGRGI